MTLHPTGVSLPPLLLLVVLLVLAAVSCWTDDVAADSCWGSVVAASSWRAIVVVLLLSLGWRSTLPSCARALCGDS